MQTQTDTAVVYRENQWYVAECPEVGVVSQGKTIEGAIASLEEATRLYLEEFPSAPATKNLSGSRLAADISEL